MEIKFILKKLKMKNIEDVVKIAGAVKLEGNFQLSNNKNILAS
jgi:hypothetical protein